MLKRVPIFAHRGASGSTLENSFQSFVKAKQIGADGIEFDIHCSSDDVLIVYHDSNLKRLSGVDKYIDDCTAEELRKYKLGTRFGRFFAPKKMPLFQEVVDWANEHKMPVNIELKKSLLKNPTALILALSNLQLPTGSHVSSFYEELLIIVKEVQPDIETAIIVTKAFNWETISTQGHIDAIHANKKYYKPLILKLCDEAKKGIRFYGIKGNESFIRKPHPAVIGWITDYPNRVRKQQNR